MGVHVLSQCDISRTSPRATWFNSHAFLLRRSLRSFCSFTLSLPSCRCSSSSPLLLNPLCPFPCIWSRSPSRPRFSVLSFSFFFTLFFPPSSHGQTKARPRVDEFWRSPGPLRSALSRIYAVPGLPVAYVANINETGVQIRSNRYRLCRRCKLFARYTQREAYYK